MQDTHYQQGQRFVAYLLIGLGVFFLAGQIFHFNFFGLLWPLVIVVPGLPFLYFAHVGEKKFSGLAFPGVFITGTGAILFYQNITHNWESWAYIWTLYPVFLGWAMTFMGERMDSESTYKVGRWFIRVGLLAFVFFFLLFEVLIFESFGGGVSRFLFPALLVGAGIFMLTNRGDFDKRKHPVFTGTPDVTKRKNTFSDNGYDPLRKKIDEALAEIDADDDDDNPMIV